MTLRERLDGAVVLGPMTKGCNLPYRRLCVELGARVTMGEMALARRLRQKRRSEFALVRRAADEVCFGIQLAGNRPDELAWAAQLAEDRGADFVDLNLGCPIDRFTRIGLGASLARQPRRISRLVAAMTSAVSRIPVTVKIRLGWDDEHRNFLDVARAAVEAGAEAVAVHGRTRNARYRLAADWDAIGEAASSLGVPVVGNGDLLFPHEIAARFSQARCAAVMVARGALIKPWIFRESAEGYRDVSAEDRVAIYRRYARLALEHWGDDERGRRQVTEFTRWHLGFWCRYAPQRPDGSWPSMQGRESMTFARSPLEALLARSDDAALGWLAERLANGEPIDPTQAPAPSLESPEVEPAQVEG